MTLSDEELDEGCDILADVLRNLFAPIDQAQVVRSVISCAT